VAAPVFLAIALRGAPLDSIGQVLRRLTLGQIGALVVVNLLALLVFSGRWAILLAGLGHTVGIVRLVAFRTAGFAISYFTPGTQFGGEPLQIVLLHRWASLPLAPAAASVTIDKALELLGNSTFLAFGIVISARTSLLPGLSSLPLLAIALAILAFPLSLVIAAARGSHPLTSLVSWVRATWFAQSERVQRLELAARQMETHIVMYLGEHPLGLLTAMGFSLASWVVMVGETWLALQFLGVPLNGLETIAVVTASRLAFLVPIPGGLGALESGLVIAFTALGRTPAEALALDALIRARDLTIGGIGLLLAAILSRDSGKSRHDAADSNKLPPAA